MVTVLDMATKCGGPRKGNEATKNVAENRHKYLGDCFFCFFLFFPQPYRWRLKDMTHYDFKHVMNACSE